MAVEYREYDKTPGLGLAASVLADARGVWLRVDSVSQDATHVVVYKREPGGSQAGHGAGLALGSPEGVHDAQALAGDGGRGIAVSGEAAEYVLVPAVREGDAYLLDLRAQARLTAGGRLVVACSVAYEDVTTGWFFNKKTICQKLTVTLSQEQGRPIPYGRLCYSMTHAPKVRYPLPEAMAAGDSFSIFVPENSGVSVNCIGQANVLIRAGG